MALLPWIESMMLDNLRSMAFFACVVEKGSFSEAARELGVTTSAVSQQIRSLETDMDVQLLHRSTRRIALTEAGRMFFQSCQDIVSAAKRGQALIHELQDDVVGELHIATTPELGATHVVPALSDWMFMHPSLKVRLKSVDEFVSVMEEGVDLAICTEQPETNTLLSVQQIASFDEILVASPGYLRQFPEILNPDELASLTCISDISRSHAQYKIKLTHREANEQCEVYVPVRLQSNDIAMTKSLCLKGHGIAKVSYLDVQRELMRGDLLEVLPQWKVREHALYAVVAKHNQHSVHIKRCLEVLSDYFRQMSSVADNKRREIEMLSA